MESEGTTYAIIQARMSSTRLPGKVLMDLAGEPVLVRVVDRVRKAKLLGGVMIATSTDGSDDVIAGLCASRSIDAYRGKLDDVLSRYVGAAKQACCDTVVRITCDCPLIDPSVIDRCIESFRDGGYDYQSNCSAGPRTFPRGLDVEVFSHKALEEADAHATEPADREHVTPYIWKNKSGTFNVGEALQAADEYRREYRLTLDYPEDYDLIARLYGQFLPQGGIVDVPSALRFLDEHPEIASINVFRDEDHVKRMNV